MSRPRRWNALLLTFVLGLAPSALAADVSAERLERAKSLFREGNALLAAGDPERALERFLASRETVASGKNTANAAICLERLARYDEALEMYEELLARFSADLDAQDRESLAPIMAGLRARLGSVDVSSNVEAQVTIDGRPRGRLPRATALRALPGKRRVRVVKEGYRTFDVAVDVKVGEIVAVDGVLEPFSGFGALRVEQAGRQPAQLLVDGQPVGSLPWEGTLPVGAHLLQAIGTETGSKPQAVQVLERKTQLIRVTLRSLGPRVRLVAAPASATLRLDEVPLGSGSWTGRLPLGSYLIHAQEAGYFPRKQTLVVAASREPSSLRFDLVRDPKSSRWPQRSAFRFGAGVGAAFLYAPTLNGDQEALCPTRCEGSRAAMGGRFEGSVELLHELGLGAELAGGYLFAEQSFSRAAFENDRTVDVSYSLQQRLVLGGGYGRAAVVLRLPLPRRLSLRAALGAGLLAASYDARASGVATTTGTELASAEAFGYAPVSERLPLVTMGLRLERALGPLEMSLGLDAWFVAKRGPRFPDVELKVVRNCAAAQAPGSVGCAPGSDLLSEERVHGLFAALFPEVGIRYRF